MSNEGAAEDVREGVAQRIHTIERTLVKVTCEGSSINCSWEELDKSFKEHYLQKAIEFLAYLKAQGWRKIEPEKLTVITPAEVGEIEPECCWNSKCSHYTETVPMCCEEYLVEGECEDRYQLNDRDYALLQAQLSHTLRELEIGG